MSEKDVRSRDLRCQVVRACSLGYEPPWTLRRNWEKEATVNIHTRIIIGRAGDASAFNKILRLLFR